MKKKTDILIRLIKFFAGLAIIQFAVACFLEISIGSDSFTVFIEGLSKVLPITVGMANIGFTLVLLVVVYFLDKSQVKIGMVLAVVFAGIILDGMTIVADYIIIKDAPWYLVAFEFAITCCVVSIGFPLMKSANLGVAPNDALYLALVKKTGKPYGLIRSLTDAVYLIFGYLCGGVVGLGTLICVVAIGPMMQFVMAHIIKQDE